MGAVEANVAPQRALDRSDSAHFRVRGCKELLIDLKTHDLASILTLIELPPYSPSLQRRHMHFRSTLDADIGTPESPRSYG